MAGTKDNLIDVLQKLNSQRINYYLITLEKCSGKGKKKLQASTYINIDNDAMALAFSECLSDCSDNILDDLACRNPEILPPPSPLMLNPPKLKKK
jgi:hypothetical protein